MVNVTVSTFVLHTAESKRKRTADDFHAQFLHKNRSILGSRQGEKKSRILHGEKNSSFGNQGKSRVVFGNKQAK